MQHVTQATEPSNLDRLWQNILWADIKCKIACTIIPSNPEDTKQAWSKNLEVTNISSMQTPCPHSKLSALRHSTHELSTSAKHRTGTKNALVHRNPHEPWAYTRPLLSPCYYPQSKGCRDEWNGGESLVLHHGVSSSVLTSSSHVIALHFKDAKDMQNESIALGSLFSASCACSEDLGKHIRRKH